jgi:hypothetical protein
MHLQSEKFSRTEGGLTSSRTPPPRLLTRPRLPGLPAENPPLQNPGYATEVGVNDESMMD